MPRLSGLILARACSDDDDLMRRLHGRTRYAMPLANRALVRYAVDAMVASGVEEVAIAVAPPTIADVRAMIGEGFTFGARFRYLELGSSETALDAIVAALEVVGTERPVLVHSGDALIAAGLADAIAEFERTRPDVVMVTGRSRASPAAAAAVVGARGLEPRVEPFPGLDNVAPAAVMSPTAIREFGGLAADTGELGGTIAALAEAGVDVAHRALEGCWCYAPDCDHLLEGNRMVLDELPHHPLGGDLESVRVEGRVAINPSAHLERTTIRGPAVIGGGVELADTFIGPYTSVGPNACMEGAEIDHSIVLAGARIRHLGHRIEASVIGADAEVARDYGMPAAVRLHVGRGSAVTLG